MLKAVDILKSLKMIMMALSVVLMLTACGSDDKGGNQDQAAIPADADPVQITQEQTECWQDDIIFVLYDIMGTVALDTYRKMTGGAMSLMMIAFAIWMCIHLLKKQFGSFKEASMGELWYEIAKKFFLCFVCGLIASQVNLLAFVLGDIIFPIYNAFLEFASELLTAATSSAGSTVETQVLGQTVEFKTNFTCRADKMSVFTADSESFPDSPKKMMGCMVCTLNDALSFGILLAYRTIQSSSITGIIVGFLVLLCFLFVKLGFVFYLIDTIFRFTLMVVMLPLMIMGYPFKSTNKLLSQGVANMLNSAGFMMFFAIIISMSILAMAQILHKFADTVFRDNTEAFKDFSVPFICILMIGFMVMSSIKIAAKLCGTFVGGDSNSKFQASAKALIVGTVKAVASGGSSVVTKLAPQGLKNKVEDLKNMKNKASGWIEQKTGVKL